jgi:hypothetical protein
MPHDNILSKKKTKRSAKRKVVDILSEPNPFLVELTRAAAAADTARRDALEMLSIVKRSLRDIEKQIKNRGPFFIE